MSLATLLAKYNSQDSSHIVCVHTIVTPVGKVTAAADENFLLLLCFEDSKNFEKMVETVAKGTNCMLVEKSNKVLQQLEDELEAYFAGELKKFTVPLKTIGTDFQKKVWAKLQELPYGSTQTYGDLAKALGREPSHARAIGAACGANAHLLIIPCHRVVASGSKGGFSSGVDRKEWLIDHEKKHNK